MTEADARRLVEEAEAQDIAEEVMARPPKIDEEERRRFMKEELERE